jgi:hypothetical protein
VRPAVEAEKLGIPSVVVTRTGFTKVAQQAAKAMGVPDLRIAEYPGAVGVHDQELVYKNVKGVLFDRIIDGLTRASGANGEASALPGYERRPTWPLHRGTSPPMP